MGNTLFHANNKQNNWLSGYTSSATAFVDTHGPHAEDARVSGETSVPNWNLNNEIMQASYTPDYTMVGSSPYYFEILVDKSENIDFLNLNDKDLIGDIHFDNFPDLNGTIRLNNNSHLTSVTFSESSKIINTLLLNHCDLQTIDLTPLKKLGGSFTISSSPNLTSLTLPTSAQTFTVINLGNCHSLGYVSFSPLSGGNNNGIHIIRDSSVLSASIVNQTLCNLDTIGWTGGLLDIDGTNAAPDSSTGGCDGLTAKANLISNGWTVNSN